MSDHRMLPPRQTSKSASGSSKVPQPPRKPRRRWLRIFAALVCTVILLLGAYVGYLIYVANGALDNVAANSDVVDTTVKETDRAQVKPISLLLLGLDYRKETGSKNTDVIMMAAFNPKTKTATVVSIPRDTLIKLEDYKKHKANAYYAIFLNQAREKGADDEAADQEARAETRLMYSKFFDVPIDYTAVLDFQGFVDVVDALGGVDVYVDQDMRYVDNADGTNIDLTEGNQTLNGEDALGFVRYRKSNRGTAGSSDFERNDRQSRVLGALVDKMKSFGTFTKFGSVIGAVGDNMRTDIPKAQITNMLSTYFSINRENIRFIPLGGTWKSPYVYLDEAKLEEAKRALAEELSPEGRSADPAGDHSLPTPSTQAAP